MNGADDSAKDQEPQEPPMHVEVDPSSRGRCFWSLGNDVEKEKWLV